MRISKGLAVIAFCLIFTLGNVRAAGVNHGPAIPAGIPVLNKSHPAGPFLVGAWVFGAGGALNLQDFSSKARAPLTVTGTVNVASGQIGNYASFTVANSRLCTGFIPTGPFSIIAVGMRAANTPVTNVYNEDEVIAATWHPTSGGTGLILNFGDGAGGGLGTTANQPRGFPTSSFSVVGTVTGWINGLKYTSSTNPYPLQTNNGQWYTIGMTGTQLPAGPGNLCFGGDNQNTYGLNGGIGMVLLFNTVLPDSLMGRLTLNPTEMFIWPQDNTLFGMLNNSFTAARNLLLGIDR